MFPHYRLYLSGCGNLKHVLSHTLMSSVDLTSNPSMLPLQRDNSRLGMQRWLPWFFTSCSSCSRYSWHFPATLPWWNTTHVGLAGLPIDIKVETFLLIQTWYAHAFGVATFRAEACSKFRAPWVRRRRVSPYLIEFGIHGVVNDSFYEKHCA